MVARQLGGMLPKPGAFSDADKAILGTSTDPAGAFSELCRIVIEVSHQITKLFGQLMGLILITCMPDPIPAIEDHPDGPKLSTLSLPYFIDFEG
jgi:hypothetical protein